MVKGTRAGAGKGGSPIKRPNRRVVKDPPWDPMNPDDDPLRDLRVHDEDQDDQVNDEYMWPEYTDEDED